MHYKLYTVHCTLYTAQCTPNTAHCISNYTLDFTLHCPLHLSGHIRLCHYTRLIKHSLNSVWLEHCCGHVIKLTLTLHYYTSIAHRVIRPTLRVIESAFHSMWLNWHWITYYLTALFCLLPVVWQISSISCRLNTLVCCLSSVAFHLSHIVWKLLSVTCHLSHVGCHLSSVACPLLALICFM